MKLMVSIEEARALDDIIKTARKQGRKIVVSTGYVHAVKCNDKIAAKLTPLSRHSLHRGY